LRFVAANAAQGNWDKVAGVYRRGMIVALVTAAAVTMLLVAGAPWAAGVVFAKPSLADPLRLMALGVLPLSLLTLHGELLKGLKRVGDAALVQIVAVPLISLPLLALLGARLGVMGVAASYVSAAFLALVLGMVLWRRAAPQIRGLRGDFETRALIAVSLPLFWMAFMDLVMNWTDMLTLGIWMESEAAGIYGAAKRVSVLISFVLASVNTIVAPQFATLHAQGRHQTLGGLARDAAIFTTLIACPFLALLILAPGWVLSLFGPDFTPGAPALAILAVGQFVNVATGSVGYLLIMTGHEKIVRNNAIVSTVLYVILQAVLVPRYGIIGAALATGIVLAGKNLALAALVYWKLSIVTLPLPGFLLKRLLHTDPEDGSTWAGARDEW
jgi:O-antigen/teichoic acid export membrane protein